MTKNDLITALELIPGNPPVTNYDGEDLVGAELSNYSDDEGLHDCVSLEFEDD